MSVWTLATIGSHGGLRLGSSPNDMVQYFGQPDDTTVDGKGRLAIMKYKPIEVHFFNEQLWLLSCEFGGPPLAESLECRALNLDPGPFSWPIEEQPSCERRRKLRSRSLWALGMTCESCASAS